MGAMLIQRLSVSLRDALAEWTKGLDAPRPIPSLTSSKHLITRCRELALSDDIDINARLTMGAVFHQVLKLELNADIIAVLADNNMVSAMTTLMDLRMPPIPIATFEEFYLEIIAALHMMFEASTTPSRLALKAVESDLIIVLGRWCTENARGPQVMPVGED